MHHSNIRRRSRGSSNTTERPSFADENGPLRSSVAVVENATAGRVGVPPPPPIRTPPPPQQQQQEEPSLLLLVQLAQSCQTHKTSRHGHHNSGETMTANKNNNTTANNNNAAAATVSSTSLDDTPCRSDLETLLSVLPHVEQAVTTAVTKHRHAAIFQLCQFYTDAMDGGFCPHATLLFLSEDKIWPRVHRLLQHLAEQTKFKSQQQSVLYICRTIARFLDRWRPKLYHHHQPNSTSAHVIIIDLLYTVTISCHYNSYNNNNNNDDIAITFPWGENTTVTAIHLPTQRHARNFHTILQFILWQFLRLQQQQFSSLADWLEPPSAYIPGDAMLQLQASLRYSLLSMEPLHQVTLDLVAAVDTVVSNDRLLLTAQALATAHRHCQNKNASVVYSLTQLYTILETPDSLSPPVIQILHSLANIDTRIGILLLRHGVPPIPDEIINTSDDDDIEDEDMISLCRSLQYNRHRRPMIMRPNKRQCLRGHRRPSLAERWLSNTILRQHEPNGKIETTINDDTPPPPSQPPSLSTAIVLEACSSSNSLNATPSFLSSKQQQQIDALIQSAIKTHCEITNTLSDQLLHTVWAVYFILQKIPCARFILGKYPVYLDEKRLYVGAVAYLRMIQQEYGLPNGIPYDAETKQCLDILDKLRQARSSTDPIHDQQYRALVELICNHPNAAIRYYFSGKLGEATISMLSSNNGPAPSLISARILGSIVRAVTTTQEQEHHHHCERLVSFWAHEHPNFRERALAFGELGRFAVAQLQTTMATHRLFQAVVMNAEAMAMKSAQTTDVTIGPKTEMHFEQLVVLYTTIFNAEATDQSLMGRFDDSIPLIVGEMVHLENKQGLNLCACFRAYGLALHKARIKLRKRSGQQNALVCSAWLNVLPSGCFAQNGLTVSRSWQRNVDEQTRDLCLTPNLMDGIVPRLLIYATSSEMNFFMFTVLQGRISMKALLESRLVSILKIMVLRVGRNPAERSAVASALGRMVCTMRQDDDNESCATMNRGDIALQPNNWRDATELVSANFMYLLVNVAQFRWSSKSIKERTQALYSLEFALEFLAVAEASQYFPQIMATVNSALAVNLASGQDVSLLWLAAIKVMDKYIHICVESSVKTVGDNLTALIVSLVPVLDETNLDNDIKSCQDVSIDLLTFLTAGDLGKKLAGDFAKVPFIPRSSRLDPIRSALVSFGVVVDDLAAFDSQERIQHQCMSTSVGSEGGLAQAQPTSAVPLHQTLHKRLTSLCPLLGNDNVRVRRVVLKHLTAVLKENRKTFQSLVETEGGVSFRRFVTQAKVQSRGIVPEIIDTLLKRCIDESDGEVRSLLASCIGEIGAIGPNKLADIDADWGASFGQESSKRCRSKPWESVDSPGFEIVSTHLVAALKAAPSAVDQHKIAFAIQQLMAILNIEMEDTLENCIETPKYQTAMAASGASRPSMNESLAKKLRDQGVYDVVEPFYFSEFQEADSNHAPRLPPFFGTSSSYFEWLSHWCRHMIRCCVQVRSDKWSALFHACRTALRSSDGIKLAEYLLPTLIAYQLCFGRGRDQDSLFLEMVNVINPLASFQMPVADKRNAVSVLLSTFAVLESWTKNIVKVSNRKTYCSSNEWSKSAPEKRIGVLLKKIPYQQRAVAAASVGMYACSLQLFEISAREGTMETVLPSFTEPLTYYLPTKSAMAGSFDATNNLVKKSLLELGDLETLTQIEEDLLRSDTSFLSARKEAIGDWQGALDEYERALQMSPNDVNLRLGNMRCSLELGHFETVLLITKGFPNANGTDFAVEACWRLGRWEALESLLKIPFTNENPGLSGSYQRCIGEAMLKLHKENHASLFSTTEKAKQIVMYDLSRAARESYARAYEHVVKLQILQEIEEVGALFLRGQCMVSSVSFEVSLDSWDKRLSLMAADGAMSVIKTRIALAHLTRDRAMEAGLFMQLGRRARKQGLANVAASSLAQAEAVARCIESPKPMALLGNLQIEAAKLKHGLGECSTALRLVDLEVPKILHAQHLTNDARDLDEFTLSKVRSALKATKWMIDGGLKGCTEIMTRFQRIHEAAPNFNKGHFEFAKFIDSLLQSRIATLQGRILDDLSPIDDDDENRRNQIVAGDRTCQSYTILCIQHYVETLRIDVKLHRYVYQALPRLLSLWFDFCSVKQISVLKQMQRIVLATSSQSQGAIGGDGTLVANQGEINILMGQYYKQIPTHAYYTAMPQVLSRISHPNSDTAALVSLLLRRVLVKYPAQSMWQIGWTRHSHDPGRRKAGNIIFQEAIKSLKTVSQRLHDLLVTSHILFSYLAHLAAKEANEGGKAYKVKPLSNEVDLLEYVPPIQAALSISLLEGDSGRSRDIFQRNIPRMRCLCSRVDVIASKAKPKKLKAFVIASEDVTKFRLFKADPGDDQLDIGELHFLLKQEAKGDLRKDARVQDLNNVVNRLLADESDSKSLACRHRISLRTFTVTCLSEDIGLIEWIPQTTALRSCIGRTINPLVDEKRGYRTGERAINFQSENLRHAYDQAQKLFFKEGNLTAAVAAFENLLKNYPPVLFWWFVCRFEDPHAWYEARKRFIISIAAWSAIGHVIGLGDRHSENILIDQISGECVHVDFDCLLDKGLSLPKPEVVPFRLTQNLIDVFGPTGTSGIFAHSLGVSMNTLRKNRDTLLSVLEPFVKDPVINWKKTRVDAANRPQRDKDPVAAARQKMRVIECRLKGIYNIRNPNFRWVHRTDIPGNGGQENDELAHHSLPLSVEGQVQKLIAEATKSENLVQIYYGWMPWV